MSKPPPQKAHEPTDQTRKTVEAMTAYGIPQAEIARVIGVSIVTMRKYYRDEIDTAAAKANARVAERLYKTAISDGREGVTAAIFWLKTRAGWRETNRTEVTGPDGGPVAITEIRRVIVDPKKDAD